MGAMHRTMQSHRTLDTHQMQLRLIVLTIECSHHAQQTLLRLVHYVQMNLIKTMTLLHYKVPSFYLYEKIATKDGIDTIIDRVWRGGG